MELDARHLRHLLAVARSGSLSRAAETLQISQPALSVSISRLEHTLGVKIMDRGRHGATLNDEGRLLLRYAEGIDTLLNGARSAIDMRLQGGAGSLTIGGTPLAIASIIPDCVARLCGEVGPAAINIVESVDEDLTEKLLTNAIDVAVSTVSIGRRPADIVEIPLFAARTVVVVRPSNRLARRRSLSLAELTEQHWVLPPDGGSFRELVDAIFLTSGVPMPANLIQAAPFSIIKDLIRKTDAITLLSDQIVTAQLAEGTLAAIPLREKTAPREFGLQVLRDRELSQLGRRFCEIARALACVYAIAR